MHRTLALHFAAHVTLALPLASEPIPLIIDTDLGFDVDDAGAIAVAHHLQDIGACRLLAIVHNTGFFKGIGGVDVINHWYNRSSVQLGAYKGEWASSAASQSAQDRYTSTIQSRYPSPIKNASQVDDAVTVYARALSGAADASVVIASIGEPTNLRDLMAAKPTLFGRKVRQVIFMDGAYNFGCADAHGAASSPYLGSTAGCAGAAKLVVESMPRGTRKLFTLNGGDVLTGGRFNAGCGLGPIKDAYQLWTSYGTRPSWDLIAVYLAVLGATALYATETLGTDAVDAAGDEHFDAGNVSSNAAQVWIDASRRGDVVRLLDDVLCSSPCRGAADVGACAAFAMHAGHNCYGDRDGSGVSHGATDLEQPPSSSCGTMTLAACLGKCDELPGCTAVTVTPQPGGLVDCYRKADVQLGACDYGDAWGFDTWVRKAAARAPAVEALPLASS